MSTYVKKYRSTPRQYSTQRDLRRLDDLERRVEFLERLIQQDDIDVPEGLDDEQAAAYRKAYKGAKDQGMSDEAARKFAMNAAERAAD